MFSDAEEGEKEQEAATEEEEGPREMTLEEYKQKHSTVRIRYSTRYIECSCSSVCVWWEGVERLICFRLAYGRIALHS